MPNREKPLEVLIIGGSGVFGSRLARLLAGEGGIAMTLAGRRLEALEQVAESLAFPVQIVTLDRNAVTGSELAPYDVVVDAAGPFQSSHGAVIEACLAARTAYVDLADGREFVADFPQYDERAREAGIPMIAGASSIPALSHAVIDHVTEGWREIESIRIGIYPGNRAPRGRSVVEAILSYVGKPVRVFRSGEWQQVPGWGMTHREDIPGLGKRWASVCDTPEQDLLVAHYKPSKSAEFFAGLELGFLHLGLAGLSQLVRFRLLSSLRPFSAPMLWAAQRLLAFGSDRGAMTVRVKGTNGASEIQDRLWVLNADANRGPNVPILAVVALLRQFRDGVPPAAGARACTGIVSLAEFDTLFEQLGITRFTHENELTFR